MKKFFPILVLFCHAHGLIAQTEIPSKTLDEIVVTANRIATPALELASSVTVISSFDIAASRKSTVIELLKDVPGISIAQQGGLGKFGSVFMRGANSNHVLVFVDGVEMNDPSTPGNLYDLSSLQLSCVEKIEIVRGPQSTLYGSDAIAGVINIFTKKAGGEPAVSLSGEYGSNNYFRGGGNISGSFSSFGYSLSASGLKSDGISAISEKYGNTEKDGYMNNTVSAKLNYELSNNLHFDVMYNYNFGKGDIDKSYQTGDDPNYTFDNEEQFIKAGINFSLFNETWSGKISGSFMKKTSHTRDEADEMDDSYSNSFNKADRKIIEIINNLTIMSGNILTFGFEALEEKANTEYFSMSLWGPYESIFPEQSNSNTGLFIQDKINIADRFFGTAGVRYDKNKKFGGVTTYRIAPVYLIRETNTKLKSTLGTGFKAPSLYNLFDPLYGNPDLKPEKSFGYEIGAEQYFIDNRISLGVTYFNTKFDDLISFDFISSKPVNISKALTSGVELTAEFNFIRNFSFNFEYTYTNAKDITDGIYPEKSRLLRRPKHKLSANFNYIFQNDITANLSIRTIGSREDDDFSSFPATRVVIGEYTIVDFAVSYKLNDMLTMYGRIDNLFDRYYEEVLFYGSHVREMFIGAAVNF